MPLQGKQLIFFLQQIDVLFLVLELVFHLQFGDLQGLGSVQDFLLGKKSFLEPGQGFLVVAGFFAEFNLIGIGILQGIPLFESNYSPLR